MRLREIWAGSVAMSCCGPNSSLNLIGQQCTPNLNHIFSRSAKRPELRAVFNVLQPGITADGRNVIFHFAEHSPTAVHAASLCGIPTIFGLGPRYIRILP